MMTMMLVTIADAEKIGASLETYFIFNLLNRADKMASPNMIALKIKL
jgi:hypothetical protein